jgi:hypothetical protein
LSGDLRAIAAIAVAQRDAVPTTKALATPNRTEQGKLAITVADSA